MLRFTSVAHKRRNCKINSPWGRKALPLSLSERITTSKSQCLMPWKFSNVLFCLTGKSTEQQHHAKHETHIYFGRCQSLSIVSDFFFSKKKRYFQKRSKALREQPGLVCLLCVVFSETLKDTGTVRRNLSNYLCSGWQSEGQEVKKPVILYFCHYMSLLNFE